VDRKGEKKENDRKDKNGKQENKNLLKKKIDK
jgi:hypothetical protein